jgi:hypothetical protein
MAVRLASIFSREDFLAREPLSPETERDSTILRLRCGGRWPESSAYFDPDSSSSRTSQTSSSWRDPRASLLEPRGERYLATWPRSAMCARGIVYPLPPSAPRTSVIGSTPLLPIPHGMPKEKQARRPGPTGNELGRAITLLPTPRARVDKEHGPEGHHRGELRATVTLLPTPTANDDNKSPEAHLAMKARMSGPRNTIIQQPSRGASTSQLSGDGKPSKAPHLHPCFVEWMLGTPAGWSAPDCQLSAMEFKSRPATSSERS